MSEPKDYYQLLGITPSADIAVIKAVYKALALKFHPDRNQSDPALAAKRMSEINEAYSVLSDEKKRAAYDKSRRGSSEQDQFDDEDQDFGKAFNDVAQQMEADWAVAIKYYPDLDSILVALNQVSKSLIIPYKLTLLEKQIFDQRQTLADQMVDAYLQTYFGKSADIKDYAKLLLKKGRRDAALELNKAVRVLGSAIDPYAVKITIENEFGIFRAEREKAKRDAEEQRMRDAEEQRTRDADREAWVSKAASRYEGRTTNESRPKNLSEVYYSGGIGMKITIVLFLMTLWALVALVFFAK